MLDRDEHHLRTGSLCDVVTRPLTSLRVTVSADCWPLQFSLSVFVWDLLRRYTHNSALLSSTLPNTVLRNRVNKGYKNLQNGGKSSHCLSHFYKRQALVRLVRLVRLKVLNKISQSFAWPPVCPSLHLINLARITSTSISKSINVHQGFQYHCITVSRTSTSVCLSAHSFHYCK